MSRPTWFGRRDGVGAERKREKEEGKVGCALVFDVELCSPHRFVLAIVLFWLSLSCRRRLALCLDTTSMTEKETSRHGTGERKRKKKQRERATHAIDGSRRRRLLFRLLFFFFFFFFFFTPYHHDLVLLSREHPVPQAREDDSHLAKTGCVGVERERERERERRTTTKAQGKKATAVSTPKRRRRKMEESTEQKRKNRKNP